MRGVTELSIFSSTTRYCSACNPHPNEASIDEPKGKKGNDDNGEEDDRQDDENSNHAESDGDTTYEEADLSEPWSDGSYSSGGGHSPSYSEIFTEEEEERKLIDLWKEEIAKVDAVTNRLKKLDIEILKGSSIGGLRGMWDLYNMEVRPISPDGAGFCCRLDITKDAVEGRLPSLERMTNSPFDQFIEWAILDEQGDITPFQLPSHPSLEAIPITLMVGLVHDVPAEIVFLGGDCLLFRIPRSTIFPEESRRTGSIDKMIEFAGLRETEADCER